MNTNGLAKLYDRLQPSERLPLILAALDRGDATEADRLSRAAARVHVGLPDYHGRREGLLFLALFHTIGQLDLGLLFWQAQGFASEWEQLVVDETDRARADRLWDTIQLLAYRLCVEADAWERLLGEWHIDPATLLRDLPCYSTLQHAERAARAIVCTPEGLCNAFDLRRHKSLFLGRGFAVSPYSSVGAGQCVAKPTRRSSRVVRAARNRRWPRADRRGRRPHHARDHRPAGSVVGRVTMALQGRRRGRNGDGRKT